MRISFVAGAPDRPRGAVRPAPGVGGKILELCPIALETPAQVLIYTAEPPQVFDGTAVTADDGRTVVHIDVPKVPPPGTPIQVVITPGPAVAPTVIEGVTTAAGQHGTIGILVEIPDDLVP